MKKIRNLLIFSTILLYLAWCIYTFYQLNFPLPSPAGKGDHSVVDEENIPEPNYNIF